MAVAYRTHSLSNNAAALAITFKAPATVVAGDVWLCFATSRGGTGNTISGVPAGFTLVSRIDNGTVTMVLVYRYTATGSETAGSNFATVTSSTSRVSVTDVVAFSGADPTGIVTETGTAVSSATQSDTNAVATDANGAILFGGGVGANSATTVTYSANLTAAMNTGGNAGSSTAAVTGATGYALGTFAAGTTFSATFGASGGGAGVAVSIPASGGGGGAPTPRRRVGKRIY